MPIVIIMFCLLLFSCQNNNTGFLNALDKKNIVLTEEYLKKGVNPNIEDNQGLIPLFLAIQQKDTNILNLLLKYHTDVNKRSKRYNLPPLRFALFKKGNDIVVYLLKNGADPNAIAGDSISSLMCAVENEDIEQVTSLIKYGANVNYWNRVRGSALLTAVKKNNFEITKLLLENHADVKVYDTNGGVPFSICCDNGNKKIAKLLIDYKAGPNMMTMTEMTPLQRATVANNIEMVKFLLDNGADPYLRKHGDPKLKKEGDPSPSMFAIISNKPEILKELLKYDTTFNRESKLKKGLIDIAESKGYKKIVEILRKKH